MLRRTLAVALPGFLFASSLTLAAPAPAPAGCPAGHFAAGARALTGAETQGAAAFLAFRRASADAARAKGEGDLAARLMALGPGRPVADELAELAGCLLRAYAGARYGGRVVGDLQEMLKIPTFAHDPDGTSNWTHPDFVRQRQWLAGRAAALGLEFKDYDGRVDEITLPAPAGPAGATPVLALLTHGDVQGVEGQQWSSPPFAGRQVGEKIVGRGSEDDKGPLVAALYVLAALRDSGWPLGATVRLLVANGEESSWDEIPYYQARSTMPDITIGLDAAYPVTHAQKGYGVLTFRTGPPGAAPAGPASPATPPKPGRWRVARLSGGSGVSIIPERGEALLVPEGGLAPGPASAELARLAADWARRHPPARLVVSLEKDGVRVVAEGKGGHSSAPQSGHNALGDLTAFLSTLDLTLDPQGALVAFLGGAVGTETDGRSLGLARRDPVLGDVTVSLALLAERAGQPAAVLNIRQVRGLGKAEIVASLGERAGVFARRTGVPVAVEVEIATEPHLVPADGPVVSALLAAWQEVTGTAGKPLAIGGGTQARLFPGGVDFGPSLDMVHYRGHGPDEYLTVDELHRMSELTMAAVWKLARRPPVPPVPPLATAAAAKATP